MKKTSTKKIFFGVFFIAIAFSILAIIFNLSRKNTLDVKTHGGHFEEVLIGSPRYINPILAQSATDTDLSSIIYKPLLYTNNAQNYELEILESLEIDEKGKIYTLTTKDSVYFSDGKKLSAEDVYFTLELIKNPLAQSPLYEDWKSVNIELIDSKTLKLELMQTYADFIHNLEIGILPAHIWKDIPVSELYQSSHNTYPIGTGPYVIKTYSYDSKTGVPQFLSMERNDFHEPKPYIDILTFWFAGDEMERDEIAKSKQVNAVWNSQDEKLLETAKPLRIPSQKNIGLFINQKTKKDISNKGVQDFIFESIKKSEIFKEYEKPYYEILPNALGQEKELTKKNLSLNGSNWEEKNSKLIHSKEENKKLVFSIAYPNYEEFRVLADKIKEVLNRANIDAQTEAYDIGDFQQKILRAREFDAVLFGYQTSKVSDLYAFWHSSQTSDPGLNITQYNNKKLDILLEQLRKESSSEDTEKTLEIIENEAPVLFLYSPLNNYRTNIKGVELDHLDRFKNIKDWYIETRKVWKMFIKK